ncbi:hypothetical protein BHU72_07620 [Desulfuribacillus stibiiarsenatis]|uniref:Uncharacterized protein n=1 Tax=Desulfuribacillus stibiiarsenatis TaxID=1390249 RepID=A0A1E5L3H9_9FIRM|nr:hypothetical protein [Desulfuribacillus stibiiarsenatis]OEH84698.1 hypothetical protein BHU72_07620 [Desulfuribacillus stibiiarsenatis]
MYAILFDLTPDGHSIDMSLAKDSLQVVIDSIMTDLKGQNIKDYGDKFVICDSIEDTKQAEEVLKEYEMKYKIYIVDQRIPTHYNDSILLGNQSNYLIIQNYVE